RRPLPPEPELGGDRPMAEKLLAIQSYIEELEYNHTGQRFFPRRRHCNFRHVTSTARDIVKESFPVQCVEAVFLAGFFTAGLKDVERFPLTFQSEVEGRSFGHIVLACTYQVRSAVSPGAAGKWGALGTSRQKCLMYKEPCHASLSALVEDFAHGYESCWHRVVRVSVGLPLPHDVNSEAPVKWRAMDVPLGAMSWNEAAERLDRCRVGP
ncbi:unnamed protein product, partial [Phaeothamnion confervicola]